MLIVVYALLSWSWMVVPPKSFILSKEKEKEKIAIISNNPYHGVVRNKNCI